MLKKKKKKKEDDKCSLKFGTRRDKQEIDMADNGKRMSQRQKTHTRTCSPNEDSDQPVYSRSLIKIFIWHILIAKNANVYHADNED